jgi:hypothetical protein
MAKGVLYNQVHTAMSMANEKQALRFCDIGMG